MIEEIARALCSHGYRAEYDSQCNMVTIYSKGYHVEIQDEDGFIIKVTYIGDRMIDIAKIDKHQWGLDVERDTACFDVVFFEHCAEVWIYNNANEFWHNGDLATKIIKEEN